MGMKSGFALGYTDEALAAQAMVLAEQYGFRIGEHELPRLQLTQQGLVLLMAHFTPLTVDFNAYVSHRRLDKKHGLIRACKPTPGLKIVDVTAGWGRDAGLLAQYGAHVVMVERQPCMAALLQDGLQRLTPGTLNLSCIHQDARSYLQHLLPHEYPDVIYIDPMHPERQKSALVKKDMQALQHLFGPDEDAKELLTLSLNRAKKRIVVKWPQREVPLRPPQTSVEGKTVRFDIYIA